jgi:uncharacterized membrane protein
MSSSSRVAVGAAAVLAACMVTWAVLVPLAPRMRQAGGAPASLAAVVDVAGGLVCHRKPERSFVTAGRQWPVCARCSGVYLAAGATVIAGLGFRGRRRPPAGGCPSAWRAAFAVALLPIALTWVLERTGLVDVSNITRALSGLPLGIVVAIAVLANLCPRVGDRPR